MSTHLLGVIGDPIEHSLSPLMHNHWFKDLLMPHHYHPFQLSNEQLPMGVEALKLLGFKGMNVTIPHKMAIIPFLDDLNEEARFLGAVNTVVREEERLIGYNTDGRGLFFAIQEAWPEILKNAKLLIIGAGGASLGIALTLAQKGVAQLDIANRSIEKAKAISDKINVFVHSTSLTLLEAQERLGDYNVVIQSTPIGMAPERLGELPLELTHLKQGTYCIDLIYNPLKTNWLKKAEEKGAHVMNGLPMLVHQGALSFEHWFGIKPETASMIAILTRHLEAKYVNR